jgi:citronellol/citronellal dehydrogenase
MYSKDLLQNKVALVTGGRSGIGFAIAKQFLQLGAKVFICSRKAEELQKAAVELSAFGECHAQPCDIRSTDDIKSLANTIKETYGRLDILINNAGGQFPALTEYINEKGWNAVINNNLNGTFFMTQQMYKSFFSKQQSGVIVNIIVDVFRGFPGMAHSAAARAGVENLTKTLAQEWAINNVRINCIAPGIIESSGLSTYPPMIQQELDKGREENPMKRYGTVEEVANAVTFYASDLSSYVSGTTLYVDGAGHLGNNRMSLVNIFRKFM